MNQDAKPNLQVVPVAGGFMANKEAIEAIRALAQQPHPEGSQEKAVGQLWGVRIYVGSDEEIAKALELAAVAKAPTETEEAELATKDVEVQADQSPKAEPTDPDDLDSSRHVETS